MLQQAFIFRTRYHPFCKQEVALAVTRQVRSQALVSVHMYCTEGITGCKGQGGVNETRGEIGVGGGRGAGIGTGSGAATKT